jgi:phosphate/sulfate permease
VKRLLDLVGMSAGGWIGWIAGTPISTFVAFIVSIVGTGFGLWATRRYVTRNLP